MRQLVDAVFRRRGLSKRWDTSRPRLRSIRFMQCANRLVLTQRPSVLQYGPRRSMFCCTSHGSLLQKPVVARLSLTRTAGGAEYLALWPSAVPTSWHVSGQYRNDLAFREEFAVTVSRSSWGILGRGTPRRWPRPGTVAAGPFMQQSCITRTD